MKLITKLLKNKSLSGHLEANVFYNKIIRPIKISLSPTAKFVRDDLDFVKSSLNFIGESFYKQHLNTNKVIIDLENMIKLIQSKMDLSLRSEVLDLKIKVFMLNFSKNITKDDDIL